MTPFQEAVLYGQLRRDIHRVPHRFIQFIYFTVK
jgi:hypothetical protein